MKFGTATYRDGARERLREAHLLVDKKQYAGSMYLAGLAVEGMLRSLLWLRDRALDERHDLRRIAVRIEELGLLRPGRRDDDFVATVEQIVARWTNDLRFAGAAQVERWLCPRRVRTKRRHELSKISNAHYEQCARVITRCEVLWLRQQKNNLRGS
jgi:HEPN domain-containing protein